MNRQKIVSFRTSENEKQVVELMATRENRSTSEMIRECIREAANSRHLLPTGLIEVEITRGDHE